jgi:hypothetical protein
MAANIIIVAVVGLILFFAVRRIVKDRKKGGCSCGCAACPSSGQCKSAHDGAGK